MSESPLERIECVRGDIVRETTDAIVNAANARLAGGGGVDGAIHRAAGPELLVETQRLYPAGCPVGEARITRGFALAARHVIHVVGPVYVDGAHGEPALLARCHRAALELAASHGLATIAFPAVSTGVYGYPKEAAAEVAMRAVAGALGADAAIRHVTFVLFDEPTRAIFESARRALLVDGHEHSERE